MPDNGLYVLGIVDGHPDMEGFRRRAAQAITDCDYDLITMMGITKKQCRDMPPRNLIALGDRWALWHEDGEPLEGVADMVRAAEQELT